MRKINIDEDSLWERFYFINVSLFFLPFYRSILPLNNLFSITWKKTDYFFANIYIFYFLFEPNFYSC